MIGVFRPESLGRLARRRRGREGCEVTLRFSDCDIAFNFATNSKSEVRLELMQSCRFLEAS
ncbi:MAG: hypothetical protein AB1758_14065 [Candidatus Eremiobacterota bacterium]